VKNNNNLPEPEVFTDKIEETIDDLFKPVKKIEIDPLTQEVKELEANEAGPGEQPEINLELSLEPEPEPASAPVTDEETGDEPELELEVAEAEEEKAQPSEPEEPEIELQLMEEQEEAQLEIEMEEGATADEDDVTARLNRLREGIYTIEWEVSGQEINEALSELRDILELDEIKGITGAHSLLALCAEVLEQAKSAPQNMKANAPGLIKRAIETVISMHAGKKVEQKEIETLQDELTTILGEHAFEKQPRPEIMEPPASSQVSEPQKATEETVEPTPVFVQAPEEEEKVATKSTGLSEEAERLLLSHIKTLQGHVKKIVPLEKLLSNTPGMEKLYKFHKNIRISLEGEIARLTSYFFEGGTPDLSQTEPPHIQTQGFEPEAREEHCPWNQLLTFSVDGMEIGVPAEEVAYISEPPWLSKSFIKKAQSLPLSKLKPWPWSKLTGQFTNKLAELDEGELAEMEFPVVTQVGDTRLPTPSSFYVIVIFNGKQGAAIRAPEAPISINVPQNAKCKAISDGAVAGEIEINGNRITVLTAESVNR